MAVPDRLRSSMLALAAALLATACASPGPDPGVGLEPLATHVPPAGVTRALDLELGVPVVEVTIGGEGPFRFLLDTGASFCEIGGHVADRLDLPASRLRIVDGPEGRSMTTVRIPSLELGDLRVEDMLATVNRGSLVWPVDGLLGLNAFHATVLELDLPARRMRVTSAAAPAWSVDDVTVFRYRGPRYKPLIPIVLHGDTQPSRPHLVDTGSNAGLALPRLLDRPPGRAHRIGTRTARTLYGTYQADLWLIPDGVRIGAFAVRRAVVGVQRDGIALQPPDQGRVGTAVLRHLRIGVDSSRQLVRLLPGGQLDRDPDGDPLPGR